MRYVAMSDGSDFAVRCLKIGSKPATAEATASTRGHGRSLYVAAPTPFLRRDECDRPDKHRPSGSDPRRGAANRRTLAAAVSKRCSTETKIIRRTIPTALGSYHQPGQRASAC